MASDRTHVIVGAALAGAKAAETLRTEGFNGRVVLVGAEPERPYQRPPLSKEYLWGETAEEELYLRPPEFYRERGIELLLGARAGRLDPASGVVELAGGARLPYELLLIASG